MAVGKNLKFVDVPLSDTQLSSFAKKLGIKLKGIFARDVIIKKHHSPCIINLDDHVGNGTHWVCCWFDKPNETFEYFDSFAVHPPVEWEERTNSREYLRNTKQIQTFESVRCGWYCLYFLHQRTMNVPFWKLLLPFKEIPHLEENEDFVKKYFEQR